MLEIKFSFLTLNCKVLFMKTEQEYINDLSEIRSMMERSTKFLSLTGWSGIMAGIYALVGAFLAYTLIYDSQGQVDLFSLEPQQFSSQKLQLLMLGLLILLLAVGTAVFLSYKKTKRDQQLLWNRATRRLVISMGIPLITGGLFILILIFKGMVGLLAPLTLIFYGLALISAGEFSFKELKQLGMVQILLGLIGTYFMEYGIIFWAIGFGVMHMAYGIYMHLKYEK